jgi:hypothetical protein
MTSERYLEYRKARRVIAGLDHVSVGPEPVETLSGLAEAMLLSRAASQEEITGEIEEIAATLRQLATGGTIDVDTAGELWRAIIGCGPPASRGPGLARARWSRPQAGPAAR